MKHQVYRKLLCLATLIIVTLTPSICSAVATVWWVNGHSYEAFTTASAITWTEASAIAEGMGGTLATITSVEEKAFVFALVNSPEYWQPNFSGSPTDTFGPWLGGFQAVGSVEPDQGWQWVTGEPWSYTNWLSGGPSNSGGNEHYLQFLFRSTAGGWNDAPVNLSRVQSYIVETVPEPASTLLLPFGGILFLRRRREA